MSFSTVGSEDADASHLNLNLLPLHEARAERGKEAAEAAGPALVPPPWSKERNLTKRGPLRNKLVPITAESSPLRYAPHPESAHRADHGVEGEWPVAGPAPEISSERDFIPPQHRRGDSLDSS